MEDLADKIADLCFKKYESLKKTGKPSENEWTILSGIVLEYGDKSLSLVSLATGTKCLSERELLKTIPNEQGCRLSDSHAEVLARRAFMRYLYDQIDLLLNGCPSDIFVLNNEKIELKQGLSFHFFSSQTPCGDCSIIPKEDVCDQSNTPPLKIRKIDVAGDFESQTDCKTNGVIKDIYRTGAKCLKAEKVQDLKLPGKNYHVTGPLRTKPGRGDPTLSLSCSDKIAKWNILGTQGSLLSLLIPPLKFTSIIIGGNCPFSLEAMERGLYRRFGYNIGPKIIQSKLYFVHQKDFSRKQPCPSSIIWSAVKKNETEIAVDGRRQGATKKKKGRDLSVCRKVLFERFLKICDQYQGTNCERHPKKLTYYNYKQYSLRYQSLWKKLKTTSFTAWPSKSQLLQEFVI